MQNRNIHADAFQVRAGTPSTRLHQLSRIRVKETLRGSGIPSQAVGSTDTCPPLPDKHERPCVTYVLCITGREIEYGSRWRAAGAATPAPPRTPPVWASEIVQLSCASMVATLAARFLLRVFPSGECYQCFAR